MFKTNPNSFTKGLKHFASDYDIARPTRDRVNEKKISYRTRTKTKSAATRASCMGRA